MFLRKTTEIPIEMIRANREQPRQFFSEQQLIELRDSIKEYGILQPLILRKENDGEYLLIAGERRLRAAAMAGLDRVPAVVKTANDEEMSLIALVENIQRENLGFIEEAKAYNCIMEKYGISQTELAMKLGKKQSTISNKIRILSLPEDIQNLIVESRLTERHARCLLKLDNDVERRIIVDKVIRHSFNVRQTEKLVEDYINGMNKRDHSKVKHISYKLYANTLRKSFCDLDIKKKGAIYNEEEDGDRLKITIIIPKNMEN